MRNELKSMLMSEEEFNQKIRENKRVTKERMKEDSTKNCPYCAETIKQEAIVCKFCRRDIAPYIHPDEQKKCPYCAEMIPKDASVCGYCGRTTKTFTEDVFPAYTPKIKYGIVDLTLEDTDLLLDSWAESYGKIPAEVKPKIKSATANITKGYMSTVMGKFLRYNLANDNDVKKLGTEVALLSYKWAFLSFAIGIEGALKNIDDKRVPLYLFVCNQPYKIYLLRFLDTLLERSRFKENDAMKMASDLGSYITETSIFLANQGFIYQKDVHPKYNNGELSPLSIELSRIDISKLEASVGIKGDKGDSESLPEAF
jgi:hypothetical protein